MMAPSAVPLVRVGGRDESSTSASGGAKALAKPKSRILTWVVRGDRDVRGCQIAVNDAFPVSGLQPLGDLCK